LGDKNLEVGFALNNFAEIHYLLKNLSDAEICARESLDIFEENATDNAFLGTALANLSGYLVAQEKFEEANIYCQKALFNLEKTIGYHNNVTKTCAANLAFILDKLKEKDPIKALKRRWNNAVEIEKREIQHSARSALKSVSSDLQLLEMEWRSTVPKQCTPIGFYLPHTFAVNLYQKQKK